MNSYNNNNNNNSSVIVYVLILSNRGMNSYRIAPYSWIWIQTVLILSNRGMNSYFNSQKEDIMANKLS